MKEFMFLFKGPYYEDLELTADQAQTQMSKWFAWIDELKSKGIYIDGKPLVKSGKVVSGKQLVNDGPFIESKELVGGYFILKAETIDDVVAVAGDFPDFEFGGSVEVREVVDLSQL